MIVAAGRDGVANVDVGETQGGVLQDTIGIAPQLDAVDGGDGDTPIWGDPDSGNARVSSSTIGDQGLIGHVELRCAGSRNEDDPVAGEVPDQHLLDVQRPATDEPDPLAARASPLDVEPAQRDFVAGADVDDNSVRISARGK